MLSYIEMKKRLNDSAETIKVKYFTEAFYKSFCRAWRTHDFEEIHNSAFYRYDSCGYCHFLEEFNDALPCWKLTYKRLDRFGAFDVGTWFIREETEDAARTSGEVYLERYGADYVEVEKAA